jgi:hypothetical protein
VPSEKLSLSSAMHIGIADLVRQCDLDRCSGRNSQLAVEGSCGQAAPPVDDKRIKPFLTTRKMAQWKS